MFLHANCISVSSQWKRKTLTFWVSSAPFDMMISVWHLLLIFTGTIRKLYARWLTINITRCLPPLRMMDLLLSAMAKFTGTMFQRFVVSTTLKDRGNNNLVWNHFILTSLILPCPPGQTLLSPILNHQPPSLQAFVKLSRKNCYSCVHHFLHWSLEQLWRNDMLFPNNQLSVLLYPYCSWEF